MTRWGEPGSDPVADVLAAQADAWAASFGVTEWEAQRAMEALTTPYAPPVQIRPETLERMTTPWR